MNKKQRIKFYAYLSYWAMGAIAHGVLISHIFFPNKADTLMVIITSMAWPIFMLVEGISGIVIALQWMFR